MDNEDRRHYFTVAYIYSEVICDVFRRKFDSYYKQLGNISVRDFLNNKAVLHKLFHLRYRNVFCCIDQCNCIQNVALPLNYAQWKLLYTENPGPGRHFCHCKYTANVIDLDDIDSTLMSFILLKCCNLTPIEEMSIQTIRRIRDQYISHTDKCRISSEEFNQLYVDLEGSVLNLDPTRKDDLVRVLKRPWDEEALYHKYFTYVLGIHEKIEEVLSSVHEIRTQVAAIDMKRQGTDQSTSLGQNDKINENKETIRYDELQINGESIQIVPNENPKLSVPSESINDRRFKRSPGLKTAEGKPCDSCEFRNLTKSASGWCLDCEQSLCSDCLEHHIVTKNMKDHRILPLSDYMKNVSLLESTCENHNMVQWFACIIHSRLLCRQCVLETCQTCPVESLMDIVKDEKKWQMETVQEQIQQLLKNTQESRREIDKKMEQLEDALRKPTIDREICARFLSDYTDIFEKILHLRMYTGNSIKTELNKCSMEIQSYLSRLQLSVSFCIPGRGTFMQAMKMKKFFIEQEKITTKLINKACSFSPEISISRNKIEQSIRQLISSSENEQCNEIVSAQVSHSIRDFRLQIISSFSVENGSNAVSIRGCAIINDEEVCFSDRANNRLIFMTIRGYQKVIHLLCSPVDIALEGMQLAVSFYESKSVETLNIETWKWENICFKDSNGLGGISFHNDNLVVRTYDGYSVINSSGKILNKIIQPGSKQPYITCSNDKLVFSKLDEHEVHCCDMSGKQLWIFKNESLLKPPNGVSSDKEGNIYVTGSVNHNVVVISSDGQTYKEILNESENLKYPFAVDYHKENDSLLVSSITGYACLYSVKKG